MTFATVDVTVLDGGLSLDLDLVDSWVAAGARYVGGCCGTSPADIALLAERIAT